MQERLPRSAQSQNETTDEVDALPSVSIIVATLNNELTIDECLRSILEVDYPKQLLEVIVVDGGSTDATIERAKKHSVKLVSETLNTPASYNYALKNIASEIVGFIDSDAKVERQWLKKLVARLNHPKVAAASGTITTWNQDKLIPRCIGYELNYRYSRLPEEVERVASMNLIIKRKVLEEVGGFDEALPTQYDTDMGAKITGAGHKTILDPSAVCYHFHRQSLREYFKQQFRYGENTWRLYLKHPRLMRGDKITDWWMNAQPILYAAATILLVISVIANFNPIVLWLFLALVLLIALQYTVSAAKISHVFHDPSAMVLIPIYFTRALAWTLGGAISFVRNIFFGRGGAEKKR